MPTAPIGRIFFGVAIAAFGVLQFIYGDFVPGRAPAWPAGLPGQLAWAWLSGALLIAAGVAIASGNRVREAALLTAAMVFGWALLRHVPLVIATPYGATLTAIGKALALCGGAMALAGATDRHLWAGRVGLGAFMILGGVQHFQYTQFVASLVPAWIPAQTFWAYFAGVALIAGGAGMLINQTARWAALLSGVMIFLWVPMLHVPRALAAATAQQRNEWTAVFEALAFSGIALLIAGSFRSPSSHPQKM
jgi:uncharacterized membrane protein